MEMTDGVTKKTREPDGFSGEFSAQGQNRTADTRIFSPLLYRLSYLGGSGSEERAEDKQVGRRLSSHACANRQVDDILSIPILVRPPARPDEQAEPETSEWSGMGTGRSAARCSRRGVPGQRPALARPRSAAPRCRSEQDRCLAPPKADGPGRRCPSPPP
jgi:hypothetical protein